MRLNMAYTEVKAISADSGRFNTLLQAAIDGGFQPVSKITVNGSQSYSIVVAKGADSSITEANDHLHQYAQAVRSC
ncbi:hypothetical protein [Escherichia phage IMM-001]|nr:hypothetical protein [Escherichia phage IMM-001]